MSGPNRYNGLGTLFATCASLIAPGHQHTASARYLPELSWPVHRDPWTGRLAQTARLWSERMRMRRELMALDDHVLNDIGLSRAQVESEARKPFWRA